MTILSTPSRQIADFAAKLGQQELEQKVRRLAEFRGGADADSIGRVMAKVWNLSVLESFAGEFH